MTVTGKKKDKYIPADPLGVDNSHAKGKANMEGKDLDKLSWIGKNWNAAESQEEKDFWHGEAETLRGEYGYSGGQDGSQFLPTQPKQSAAAMGMGVDTGKRPVYQGGYQNEIDRLLDEVMGRRPFEYDPTSDPLYQLYTEQFTRNGQRAMQDTIGQVSARTGGLASSYAGAAGQQVYDQYMTELSGMIPELRQLAYEMYLQDLDQKRDDLSVLVGLDEAQYGRFRDAMGDWENDRDFAYGKSRDVVADSQWQQTFDYNAERDKIEDQRYEEERDYQRAQDAKKASDPGKPALTAAQTLEALENGIVNETTMAAFEFYFGEPYDEGTPDVGSYSEAISYLEAQNIPSESRVGLMTENEWKRRKASYQNYGQGSEEVVGYDTYADYVKDYVLYCIETYGE